MRLAVIFGVIMFAFGAFIAERYGLPDPVTRYSDMGFAKVEGWVGLEQREPAPVRTGRVSLPSPETGQPATASAPREETRPAPAPQPEPPRTAADHSGLSLNADGMEIIKASRGLSLSAVERYGDWHIGYAHSGAVSEDMTVTVPEAEQLLIQDLSPVESGLKEAVTVPLNANEYSALVSFADSMGLQAFLQSDVYQALEAGNREAAADAMLQHTTVRVNGQVTQMPSLVERRARERQLFLRRP